MCVGIPFKVIEIKESKTGGKPEDVVEIIEGEKTKVVKLDYVAKVRVGDYVIIDAEYVTTIIDMEEARETLRLMQEVYVPENETYFEVDVEVL